MTNVVFSSLVLMLNHCGAISLILNVSGNFFQLDMIYGGEVSEEGRYYLIK